MTVQITDDDYRHGAQLTRHPVGTRDERIAEALAEARAAGHAAGFEAGEAHGLAAALVLARIGPAPLRRLAVALEEMHAAVEGDS